LWWTAWLARQWLNAKPIKKLLVSCPSAQIPRREVVTAPCPTSCENRPICMIATPPPKIASTRSSPEG
jgi:hypothetical protein